MRSRATWLLTVIVLFAGCLEESTPQEARAAEPPLSPSFVCEQAKSFRPENVTLRFDTTKGAFSAVLFGDRAPVTVCNFLRYVEEDFYDRTIFHRVCPGFVVQAGGLDITGMAKPAHESIRNEANRSGLSNVARTLSMARSPAPDSASSHFFINLVDNQRLDPGGGVDEWGYAVFGIVTEGWSVVEEIGRTLTVPSASGCMGRPIPTLETTIRDITIVSPGPSSA